MRHLTHTPLSSVEVEDVASHHDRFLASGLNLRELMRSVVQSEDFRARDGENVSGLALGPLTMSPEQLERNIRALTGFEWQGYLPLSIGQTGTVGRFSMLTDSLFGLKTLAGGTDGYTATVPLRTHNATSALVVLQLAAEAAHHVASGSGAGTWNVDFSVETRGAAREEIARAMTLAFGRFVDGEEAVVADALELLFDSIAAGASRERAWTLTLAAILQDFESLHY
jgi:hypothetical protein